MPKPNADITCIKEKLGQIGKKKWQIVVTGYVCSTQLVEH